MSKKLLPLLLSLALLFGFSVRTSAVDVPSDGSDLYVATVSCPPEYITFAQENVERFILSTGEEVNTAAVTVGTPFAFADVDSNVYYFPVLCNGVITYLFRVYPDGNGGYDGAISAFLAKELEELADKTSVSSPLQLNLRGNKIVATVGEGAYTLFEYPAALSVSQSAAVRGTAALSVVDAKESVQWNLSFVQPRSSAKYLTLSITETQFGNNWCTAYCTAAIVRTLGYGNITARTVMQMFYRSPTSLSTLTNEQVVTYAHYEGLYPTYVPYTVVSSVIINDITYNRPVYIVIDPASNADRHAVVIRGYSTGAATWSIWNPWFSVYETISMNGTYVPTGYPSTDDYTYTYTETIYNWAP